MNINRIVNGAKAYAYKALDLTNEMGKAGREAISYIATGAAERKDQFIKNEQLKSKLNKDTVVGLGLVAGALVLAKDCIKGITGKVKEIKDNK